MRDDEDPGAGHQVQRHRRDLRRVLVPVLDRQPAGHHVAVVDRLHLVDTCQDIYLTIYLSSVHLVDVVVVYPGVEELVEGVEEGDDLHGVALGHDVGELHNVTAVVELQFHVEQKLFLRGYDENYTLTNVFT